MGFYTDEVRVGQRLLTTFDTTTTPTAEVVLEIIDEVENEIDSAAGRSYRKRNFTSEYHDYNGIGCIVVKNPGLNSVTSLEYTDDDGSTWTTIPSTSYDLYTDFDMIEFKPDTVTSVRPPIPTGNRVVRISYSAGPSVAPYRITKLATSMACLEVIRTQVNSSANSTGGEVQVGPIRVTEPGSFSVTFVRELKAEIADSLARLSSGRIRTTVAKRWD
jgi:hypothetical protein